MFALVVLAPLGLCLGMFMPFGLGLVNRLTEHGEDYSAWSWAVNGFFSVIGSVLTTILSMVLGFGLVQYLALAIYAVAVIVFLRLHRHSRAGAAGEDTGDEPTDATDATAGAQGALAPASS
jgi:MFS family permease